MIFKNNSQHRRGIFKKKNVFIDLLMADKPFRVLLDLTDLHVQNFKYVWVNVSPRELKTISDFKTAIQQKINLERDDIKLYVRDGLLLEEEIIIVLREDDTVKVQYEDPSISLSAYNSEKESKKGSRKRSISNVNEYDVPSNKKTCKLDTESSAKTKESSYLDRSSEKHENLVNSVSLDSNYSKNLESNHNKLKCKKKKKDKMKSISLENNSTESYLNEKSAPFFSFDVVDTTAEQHENTAFSGKKDNFTFDSNKKSSSKTNSIKHQETKEMQTRESFVLNTNGKHEETVNISEKKRNRSKKHKHTGSAITDTSLMRDAQISSFSDNEEVKRKHIIYSPSSHEKNSSISGVDKTNGIEESPKDTFVVNKNISPVNSESLKDYPKISTPSQSNDCDTNSIKHQETKELETSESFVPNAVVKQEEAVNVKKKKRKRRKKHKHTESAITDTSYNIAQFSSFTDNEEVKRKHIIYSPSSNEKDSSINGVDKANGIGESPKDTFVVNKNISVVNSESLEDYPKISTPSQSNYCGNLNWQISLTQSRNSVYDNEVQSCEKDVIKNDSVSKSLQNLEDKETSQIQYDDLPAMNSMPKIGTYIAYKALELDDSYSPVISEYREGIVQSINPDTEELNIELLKHMIKPGRTGRFENLKNDELPPPEVKKFDLLRWSDLISPKQLL